MERTDLRLGSRNLIRDLNIAAVLGAIRRQEPISRVEIAARTGLGKSTVTGVVSRLLALGLVREVGAAESSGGRRPILLELNPTSRLAIGVKLAPGSVTTAACDLHARPIARSRREFAVKRGEAAVMEALVGSIQDALRAAGGTAPDALGVGVALPGIVDPVTGTSISSHLLDWADFPLRERLEQEIGLPVFIDNDANAYALAEWSYGAGRNVSDLVAVTVGIGVGSGIVAGGQLYRGAISGAGEIGHITIQEGGPLCRCGNQGCLEALASDVAISRRAQELGLLGRTSDPVQAREAVATKAAAGDRTAIAILAEAGSHLGTGIANAVNLLNPKMIVLGGEAVEQAGDFLLPSARAAIARQAFSVLARDVLVVRGRLGADAWLMGAASLVLDEVFRPPLYRPTDPSSLSLSTLVAAEAEGR